MPRRVYLVVREVRSDQLRICGVDAGAYPASDAAYTWGGPFQSRQAAKRALAEKSSTLRRQLYPQSGAGDGVSIDVKRKQEAERSPGPRSLSDLFRF